MSLPVLQIVAGLLLLVSLILFQLAGIHVTGLGVFGGLGVLFIALGAKSVWQARRKRKTARR